MNPLVLLFLVSLADQRNAKNARRFTSPYFDTFKMELLLDKLHGTVNALEKINRLNQLVAEPSRALKAPEQAAASLPPPADMPNPLAQIAQLAPQLSQLGDMKMLMQNLGPLLAAMGGTQEK